MNVKLLSLIPMIVFGSWLHAHWSGLFNYDTFFVLNNLYEKRLDDWFSYLYSLYLMALGQPYISVGYVGAFQVVAASVLGTYFLARLHRLGCPRIWCLACLTFFAISPINAAFNIYYIYDWPATWLQLTIAMTLGWRLWENKQHGRPLSLSYLLMIGIGLAVLVRLRADNLPMVIIVPLVLQFFFKLNWQQWRHFLGALAGTLGTVYVILPTALNIIKYDDYALTTVINPLGHVLAKSRHAYNSSPEAERERRTIEKVMDYQMIIRDRSDFEIPAFHNGATREHSTEDRRALYFLCVKLFTRHWDLFLANRMRMFRAVIGEYSTFYTSDGLTETYPFALEVKKKMGLAKESLWPQLWTWLAKIEHHLYYTNGFAHHLFATAYLGILLCLFVFVLGRRLVCSAIVALLVASRLPLVFLFAPASQFKYVYGIYLLPFFLIPLVILELKLPRPIKD